MIELSPWFAARICRIASTRVFSSNASSSFSTLTRAFFQISSSIVASSFSQNGRTLLNVRKTSRDGKTSHFDLFNDS